MLGDSYDSFIAVFLLAGRLSLRQLSFLILALGFCDGVASYVGPTASFVPFFLHAQLPIIAIMLLFYVLRDWRPGTWPLIIATPLALCYDNLFSYAGHPTNALCALDFGLASSIMASLGAVAFYSSSVFAMRTMKAWRANG
jgi:hypothetical protein